jgi:hypothetical protein
VTDQPALFACPPAASTPLPLPREREPKTKRPRLALAASAELHIEGEGSGLAPAKAIQTNEATRARRNPIQLNEDQSDPRLVTLARIERVRIEIRELVDVVVLGADIELLDLMRDETGSYSRHKAAQEARKWADAAGIQIETGLMMLDRALRSAGK